MPEVIKLRVASSEESVTLQSASGSLAVEVVSPRVAFAKVSGGTRIDVTDIDGTKSAVLPDGATGPVGPVGPAGPRGETGPVGPTGSDGVSPTASVTQTVTGAVVTVTDASGTTTATLTHGPAGPQGERGPAGQTGSQGVAGNDGVTFTPSVSSEGVISWTNDGDRSNPQSINIRGPQGLKGDTGDMGPKGDSYILTNTDKNEIAGIVMNNVVIATTEETKAYLGC